MVDSSKRRSLKSIGGMMAAPLVPAMLIPATSHAKNVDATNTVNNIASNEELSISLILGDEPMMKVTNNSDTLSIMRRIHPGVVHAGGHSYDLNHSLASSSYAIRAGQSRVIPIKDALKTLVKPVLPASYDQLPLRIAAVTADNAQGRVLNSLRAFVV